MGILANYKALDRQPPELPLDITPEAKKQLCWELLSSGDTPTTIYKYLGVSRQTVYNWKAEADKDHFEFLSTQSYAQLFSSDLKWVEEEVSRYEQMSQALYNNIVEVELDEQGIPVAKLGNSGSVRDYNDCRRVVMNLKKMKTEILSILTLKNKEGDPSVHGTISEKNVIEQEVVPKLAHEENVREMIDIILQEQPTLKNVE